MMKELDGHPFNFVSKIEPQKDENGIIIRYNPKDLYKKKDVVNLNKYGEKSFCYFDIKKYSDKSGVYALFVNDNTLPEYIGRANNFDSRWSRVNYGAISPKNCYVGGQSTNCHRA